MQERESKSGGSWQLLCALSLRWQMCHIVRAATCLAAAKRLTAGLFVTSLYVSLSVGFLRPLIYQFAIASNIPISRQTQKHFNCSLKLKKSEYKSIEEAIRRLNSVE